MKYIKAILFITLFLFGIYYTIIGMYGAAVLHLVLQSIVYVFMKLDEIHSDIKSIVKGESHD